MRILHIITQSKLAGAEIYMLRLCSALRNLGHDTIIVCRPGRALDEQAEMRGLRLVKAPIQGKLNPAAARRLVDIIDEVHPDVIHTHNSTASLWGGWAGKWRRLPVVSHMQGINWRATVWSCYHAADHIIACSEAVRRHLLRMGFAAHRVHTIHNSLPFHEFRPRRAAVSVRDELGLDSGHCVFGTFAHLAAKKGYDELLAAIARVHPRLPRARWLCVGAGRQRQRLEARAAALGLSGVVRFLGFRRDVPDLMNAIDIFVLPSRCEPFGIVFVEAMSLGKPVIACCSGGAPEVIADGETGRLISPRNPLELAGAMQELAVDEELRARFGAAGLARARRCFQMERSARATEGVYHLALSQTTPRRLMRFRTPPP